MGFSQGKGHWVLINEDGDEIEESDVLELKYNSALKKWQVTAIGVGSAYLRYMIDENVYTTVGGAISETPKYITNSDIKDPAVVCFVVGMSSNRPYSISVSGLPEIVQVGAEAIDLNGIEGLNIEVRDVDGKPVENFIGELNWELKEKDGGNIEDGLLSFSKPGKYHIRATYTGESSSQWYAVKASKASKLTEISFDPDKVMLGVGDSLELKPVRKPAKNKDEIAFTSNNTEVIAVDEFGVVTAKSAGTATVTVKAVTGLFAQCEIKVLPAPEGMTLAGSKVVDGKLALRVKETAKLAPDFSPIGSFANVVFTSSAPKIAKIDAEGTVKALKQGTCVITATTYNGLSASVEVTVSAAPKKLVLNEKKLVLKVGESFLLEATDAAVAVSELTFTSNKPGVVSVDAETGLVTANMPGKATVTAKAPSGTKAKCKVTVTANE